MKKFKIAFVIVVVLALGGLAVWIFIPEKASLSSTQETKALKSLLGRDPHLTENTTSDTWTVHRNRYVSFDYPSGAILYTKDNIAAMKNPATLDSFSFNLPDDHVYGVVQVVQWANPLSEYPAVNLRLSQSDMYTTASGSASLNRLEFSKSADVSEKSLFIKKGDVLVSVAITGYSATKISPLFSRISSSLTLF